MNKVPIFIPTKGRAQKCRTFEILSGYGLKPLLVVEPSEHLKYKSNYPHAEFSILPENGKGIAYVRNFILSLNLSWYWMIDDDIDCFYFRRGSKMVKDGPGVLAAVESKILGRPEIAQSALEYQQLAWSANKPYIENGYCDVCVLIDAEKAKRAGASYDDNVRLKEDRDFTLQLITGGFKTIRTTLFAFSCPKNGSNAGGLKDVYDSGIEKEVSQRMVNKWGHQLCEVRIKNDGRPDVKINWGLLR